MRDRTVPVRHEHHDVHGIRARPVARVRKQLEPGRQRQRRVRVRSDQRQPRDRACHVRIREIRVEIENDLRGSGEVDDGDAIVVISDAHRHLDDG